MSEPFERNIRCQDAFGRDRVLRVFLSGDGKPMITAPPGESAALSWQGVTELQKALTKLVVDAVQRGERS